MVKDVCSSPRVPNDTTICCNDTVPQRKNSDFSYIYSPSQMMVGKQFSFWNGPFSGDVSHPKSHRGLIQMLFQASFQHDGFSFLTVPKQASHKWPINGGNTSWTRHKAEKAKQSQFSCFSRLFDKRWTSLPNDVHPKVKKPFLATTSLDNQPLTKTINLWIQSCKALAPKNWTWRLFNEISITFQTLKRQMPLGE